MATSLPILTTLVHGEQKRLHFTFEWLTDISTYTIAARVVEGDNDGIGSVPTSEDLASKTITTLDIINVSANELDVVLPSTLIDSWDAAPTPDKPVYGYFDISIDDGGVGSAKQIFKPVQGLIKITYSPLESTA